MASSRNMKGVRTFRKARDSFRGVFPGLFVLGKAFSLAYSSRSFLVQSGFFESVRRKKPCRRDGTPIPWMNYPMIEFFEHRLTRDMTIFEYGSGNSTLFFAERVRHVTSVECDQAWHDYIKDGMPENVTLLYVAADEKYVPSIDTQGTTYDLILVDAEHRMDCLKHAPAFLSGRGVILLDDAERNEYRDGIDDLLRSGFRELPFNGLKAGGVRSYRTTVFYRDNNCFGI